MVAEFKDPQPERYDWYEEGGMQVTPTDWAGIEVVPQAHLDLDLVHQAFEHERGPDQRRIAEVGLHVIATLLRKNADYGGSAWQAPLLCPTLSPRTGILVRMSDKIRRFCTLLSKPAEVKDETIDATMLDFGGYSILYLAYPGEGHDEKVQPVCPDQPDPSR